jgi:Glycosyltransferase family 87/WD40-like Beta Propeller Repeat
MTLPSPEKHIPLEHSGAPEIDHHSMPRRWVRVAEWLLFALLAAHMGFRSLPKAWHTLDTDFPNYYLTASLVREHYDTSRIYEWIWFQRQKDHRDIDQRVVGMVPLTPISTLVFYPLTPLPPLAAKRCWIIVSLGLLLATLYLLHAMTLLPWRRLALVAALSFPLTVNFQYGQFYVLLLFLLTLACWLYVRQRRFLSGVVVGLAAGLKVFPAIYLVYFLRKRDLRAFVGGVAGSLCTGLVSFFVFGWELNRLYLTQVLPSVLRGETVDPYNLQPSSFASLLHRLFIYEPQMNQHPAMNAPWLFALLHPLFQMAILAPALLLAIPNETRPRQVRLEWAAIILASLAISTSPTSYLFTLLILPVCLVLESFPREKPYLWTAALVFLYAAAGYLHGTSAGREGWLALFGVPRLYALILLCVFTYALLVRREQYEAARVDRRWWAIALSALVVFNIASGLRQQQGLYADYQWRIPAPTLLMAADPAIQEDAVPFIALLSDGYHSAVNHSGTVQFNSTNHDDHLAVTAAQGDLWVEHVGEESTIASTREGQSNIQHAESPVASFDGKWLAFLREDRGRARIWVRDLNQPAEADRPLTPPELNVLEMSFLPSGDLVFSAASGGPPSLFAADKAGGIRSLGVEGARYPAASPDGHWLAYSELQKGNWNLWLRNLDDGQTSRLTHAACNSIEPVWTADSKTLVYASDCGRGPWITALCRRRIFR